MFELYFAQSKMVSSCVWGFGMSFYNPSSYNSKVSAKPQAGIPGHSQMRELADFMRRQERRAALGSAGGAGGSDDEDEAEEEDMLAALGARSASQGVSTPAVPGTQQSSQQVWPLLPAMIRAWDQYQGLRVYPLLFV